jgi:hypothetical protein
MVELWKRINGNTTKAYIGGLGLGLGYIVKVIDRIHFIAMFQHSGLQSALFRS